MTERFVASAGTISVANGASTVVGTGTLFAGRDRAGAQVWAQPAASAPVRVGTVAEVDPRGVYSNLSLPLVSPYNGTTLSSVAYELVDGPAIANGATQAAIYARFAAFLEQNMGLAGNTADDIDYSLVPNNSIFVDSVTHGIYQWRNGALELVNINAAFNPIGAWSGATTYAQSDLVDYGGGVFVSNNAANLNHAPVISPAPASDAFWTVIPLPRVGELFGTGVFVQGRPLGSETVYRFVFVSTVLFAAGLTTWRAISGTAATGSTVFSLRKNGVQFGTMTFAGAATTATFAAASDTTFTAGDIFTVIAPAVADATLADVALTTRGLRDGGLEFNALPLAGGQLTGALAFKDSVDVASAATCNIGAATSNNVRITGTTGPITAFDNVAAGVVRWVRFASTPQVNHSAALLLPGAANIVATADSRAKFRSLGSGNWFCEWWVRADGKALVRQLYTGSLFGLTLSNNGTDAVNDIDIAAGSARDGGDTTDLLLAAAITKRLDAAWAVGTAQGGRDTGAISDAWWHVWLISRSDTGVVDVLFSLSATAPTMPTNYDSKRRIGAVLRASATLVAFRQYDDTFILGVPVNNASASNPGTAAVVRTLTVPPNMIGIFVYWLNNVTTAAVQVLITEVAQADTAPSTTLFTLRATATGQVISSELRRRADASSQIRARHSASGAADAIIVTTVGWADSRGRLA